MDVTVGQLIGASDSTAIGSTTDVKRFYVFIIFILFNVFLLLRRFIAKTLV